MIIEPQFVMAKEGVMRGVILSGGSFLKNEDDKNRQTFRLGAGVGVFIPKNGGDPYIPLFMEGGYFNKNIRITPVVVARVGYGFYKGSLGIVEENGPAKGGVFGSLNGGVGIKVARPFFIVPTAGLSIINLRHKILDDGYSKGLFNIGLTLFFTK